MPVVAIFGAPLGIDDFNGADLMSIKSSFPIQMPEAFEMVTTSFVNDDRLPTKEQHERHEDHANAYQGERG